MYAAILIRRLKPGRTYADFVAAWYPDEGFGVPVQGPDLGVSLSDVREIAAIAYVDLPDGTSLEEVMARVSAQEAMRHDRIAEVIEETVVRGLYEIRDRFDFSTDESVAATAPPGLNRD